LNPYFLCQLPSTFALQTITKGVLSPPFVDQMATAVRKVLGLPGEALAASAKSSIRHTIFGFKEQLLKPMGLPANIFTPTMDEPRYKLKITA